MTKTCKDCRLTKNRDDFYRRGARCRACIIRISTERNRADPAAHRAICKRHYYRRTVEQRQDENLRKLHGITREQYLAMLAEQNGVCASCGKPETARNSSGNPKNLAVDHCHATGVIRGLLCHCCNISIGLVKESPEVLRNCATYLEKHAQATPG